MALSRRTLTFVFTDIAGSTNLLRQLGDEYASLLSEHHAILDIEFGREGGVRNSTEGDGSFFVFDRPDGAVRAVGAVQRTIASRTWPQGREVRLRIGVHTGEVSVTDDGRFIGLAVHLAARLGAMGHGGQTLCSGAVFDASALEGCPYVRMGVFRVSDFPEPVEVFQVGDGDFPPLRALAGSGIPDASGRLYGRAEELAGARRALVGNPLVTLTGPGGAGKTRLAIDVARSIAAEGSLVAFVDLAAVSDPGLIVENTEESLGLVHDETVDAVTRIAAVLSRREGVLVLDNCEELTDAVGRFVLRLLKQGGRFRILATSRRPLGVREELVMSIGPLRPDDAVELFLERAAAHVTGTSAEDLDRTTMAHIVSHLDGLPLALELAAPLVRTLPLEEIDRLVGEGLDVLESQTMASDRHRSLSATLESSVAGLTPMEKLAFETFGVMLGRFTVDDVAAVAGLGRVDAIRTVGSLADRSLVIPVGSGHLRVLETIRLFAREMLMSGGSVDAAARRHLLHHVAKCKRFLAEVRTPAGLAAIERMADVRPNLLTALRHAEASGDIEAVLVIVEALVDIWGIRSAISEADTTIGRLLASLELRPIEELRLRIARLEARQLGVLGIFDELELAEITATRALASSTGDRTASLLATVLMARDGAAAFDDALAAAYELGRSGDQREKMIALEAIGWASWWRGDQASALRWFERMVAAAREAGDPIGLVRALSGAITVPRRELPESMDRYEEAAHLAERLGLEWWETAQLEWWADWSQDRGDFDEAAEWLDWAYVLATEDARPGQVAIVTGLQALVSWERGDIDATQAKLVEFARASVAATGRGYNPFVIEMAAGVACRRGDHDTAAILLAAAHRWREPGGLTEHGMVMPAWDQPRHEAIVSCVRTSLPEPRLEKLSAEGTAMHAEDVWALALGL